MRFPIAWKDLGWGPTQPKPGLIQVLVLSPWCPDCQAEGARLAKEAQMAHLADPAKVGPLWIVGEFAPREQFQAFAEELGLGGMPLLYGKAEKSAFALAQARFREIREAFADSRQWGVPSLIEGTLDGLGKFTATSLRSQ